MTEALAYLSAHSSRRPTLASIAKAVDLSPYHFQRTFKEWVGVSPKQFQLALERQHARASLLASTVEQAALELSHSSTSRLYDNLVRFEALTPGEVRAKGKGVTIDWGTATSPFGECLIAWTSRGINKIAFYDSVQRKDELIDELKNDWSNAQFVQHNSEAERLVERVFANSCANTSDVSASNKPTFCLWVRGTAFQVKVWEALLALPEGQTATYQQIAEAIGNKQGVRAVASAIAANPIGYLIPCHRVILSTGELNQYRWGAERKAAILFAESTNSFAAEK